MANKIYNVWLRNSKSGKIRVIKIQAETLTAARSKAKRAGTKRDKVMRIAAAAVKPKKKKIVKKKKVAKKKTAKKTTKKKPVGKKKKVVKKKKSINPKKRGKKVMAKRKKKRSTPKRRRGSALLPSGTQQMITTGLLSAGGAVAGSVIANQLPVKDERIKAFLPLALGVGMGFTRFGRGKMIKPMVAGLVTVGTLSVLKQFFPKIPLLAGEENLMVDYADRDLVGYDELPDEELLGVTANIGEEDLEDIDTGELVGDSVEIEGEDFITSADL